MDNKVKELVEEYHSLMQAGLNELPDIEVAEEYFSDACYVLNQIQDKQITQQLEQYYSINPRDFAQ